MSEQAIEEEKLASDTNNNENDSNSGSATGYDSQICRDYQRGVCNRGGKCKFSHPDGLGKEMESGPMICRDFQNGKCSRSTCKYLHISNTEEKVYLRTGQLPMRRPPMPARVPGHGYPTRANRGDPICKDFLNNKCTRGSACKFRHSYEDDKGGYGPPGGYGFDDYPRKRRRDSYGDADYGHLKEENESLRRQVSDLQKQVSDLKATNEVLLEQNARYRNQASSSTAYPPTPSYAASSYVAKTPTAAVAAPTNYASSYLTAYNGNTTASSYTTDNPSYTTTSNYGVTSSDSTAYSSSYPTGTGYIKFE
ncbi:zinc finger CCCH domain-containing protein 10-like [Actinia tenebrosa]|uniref:Zinc finger CCCH domain-containing protein 10-like n=1 Tax=Actinia tenebrosa TaxID=6105 RepID=A0A6P8HAU5_ACTTE|nr:zinc finger CCCH domain-containing protein 10-like [Actinia tenebrosa]